MNYTRQFSSAICALVLVAMAPLASRAQAPAKRAIIFDDLIGMHRLSEPQISPDGKWVAYRVATPDKEANRSSNNIWLVSTAGGPPKQLTRSGRDSQPQWSPDGKRIAFLSSRDGGQQVFLISVEGGEASKLTSLSTGADNVRWSPDGKLLAFTSEVYPDCRDDACNSKRDSEREKSKVKARLYDRLLYRHWTSWSSGKRSHLFVVATEGGTPRDLTAGADYDVPPVQRGDAADIAFSPDGKELCYTAVPDPVEATSTNGELFVVAAEGGAPRRITSNPGFDGQPTYSPDGRFIAYRAQMKAGYESDRWRLMLYDRKSNKHISVAENFDRSVDNLIWSPDSKAIYFHAEERAQSPIFAVAAAAGSEPKAIVADGFNGNLSLNADGRLLAFTRSSLTMPAEVFLASTNGGGVRQITSHNAEKLAALEMNKVESFWFEGAEGAKVHGLLLRPPHFDSSKKYPLLFLVHGGPQGAWNDSWGFRWNEQIFAAPGYVVVMINPRGSTGYGQKFTDEINADWGGKVFTDLMKGLDYVLANYPFLDGTRMAAAGGSYGGYMMNWFGSHTQGRFKCFITHAGVYNNDSMYGATEELWFPEWDLRGTPWKNAGTYDKWSPHKYAGEFGKYKTPTLVIHGELDFRVPYTEGLQLFTALQRQGVPSKLLIYPDEGHWIGKPQNSELWYRTFLDWLATYLK